MLTMFIEAKTKRTVLGAVKYVAQDLNDNLYLALFILTFGRWKYNAFLLRAFPGPLMVVLCTFSFGIVRLLLVHLTMVNNDRKQERRRRHSVTRYLEKA